MGVEGAALEEGEDALAVLAGVVLFVAAEVVAVRVEQEEERVGRHEPALQAAERSPEIEGGNRPAVSRFGESDRLGDRTVRQHGDDGRERIEDPARKLPQGEGVVIRNLEDLQQRLAGLQEPLDQLEFEIAQHGPVPRPLGGRGRSGVRRELPRRRDERRFGQFLAPGGREQGAQAFEAAARVLVHVAPQRRDAPVVAGGVDGEAAQTALDRVGLAGRGLRSAVEHELQRDSPRRRPPVVRLPPFVVPDGERRTDRGVGEELPQFGIRVPDQRPTPVAGQLPACPLPLGAVGERLVQPVEAQMPDVVAVHQRLGSVVQPPLDQCVAFGNRVTVDRDLGLEPHVAGRLGGRDTLVLGRLSVLRRRRVELEVQALGHRVVGAAGKGHGEHRRGRSGERATDRGSRRAGRAAGDHGPSLQHA